MHSGVHREKGTVGHVTERAAVPPHIRPFIFAELLQMKESGNII